MHIDTAEIKELSPREQVRSAFDSLVARLPWREPDRKFAGNSTSTRELRLVDPSTGSTIVLSEIQRHAFIFGVDVQVGEPARRVQWTARDSHRNFAPRAEVVYRDDGDRPSVHAQFFLDSSPTPVENPFGLDYFYKRPDIYPSPQTNFKPDDALTEIAFLLERKAYAYVEQLDLAPAQ